MNFIIRVIFCVILSVIVGLIFMGTVSLETNMLISTICYWGLMIVLKLEEDKNERTKRIKN